MVTTERLILRRWRESDLGPFAALNADPCVMEFFPSVLSEEESDALITCIENHFQKYGYGLCAVEMRRSGALLGFIGLNVPAFESHFTPCVEIGWRLAPNCWGQGLATEGARAIVQFGFETVGLGEIVSFTVPANLRSRRVMEKLGMTHDPVEDFDHPLVPSGHPLRRHVLYRLGRANWSSR